MGLATLIALLELAGVSSAYATRSLTAVQQAPDSDCNVPGFTFREGQLPHDKYFIDSSPVNIYSLPYGQTGSPKPKPFATLAATAAACQDDSACGMFTSNGYIVGANWRANDASVTKAFTKESDILKWHTMHNCSGRKCCGTWVADGFVQQLLQPITTSQSNIRSMDSNRVPSDDNYNYGGKLNPALEETVCAGKPALYTPPRSNTRGVPAKCPELCIVACCALLEDGETFMSFHHFSQCTHNKCADCLFATSFAGRNQLSAPAPPPNAAPAPAPVPAPEAVLLRSYLRAKALEAQQQQQQQQRAGQSAAARGG